LHWGESWIIGFKMSNAPLNFVRDYWHLIVWPVTDFPSIVRMRSSLNHSI
jgi:hypothetical protein